MIYLIVLCICLLFMAFFALLELWYFWIFPLLFLVMFFSQSFVDMRMSLQWTDFLKKYGLYCFSLLAFFWLLWILEYFWLSHEMSFFVLLMFAWIAWYLSYFIDYEDWKSLFFHGLLFILILLLWNSYIDWWSSSFSAMLWFILWIAIVWTWWLWFLVWNFKDVDRKYLYYFYYFILLGILDVIFINVKFHLYAFDIDLAVYLWVMVLLAYALSHYVDKPAIQKREISLRRILAWEKILSHKKDENKIPFMRTVSEFVRNTPELVKYLLEYLNVVLLVWLLLAYLIPLFQWKELPQMWYWAWVLLFLVNSFFLKKYWIFTVITRFAVWIIVNFSLYISLLTFGENITEMLPWLIAWNILCWIVIFYTKLPTIRVYIKQSDIAFWLIICLVAMMLNIVLLLRLDGLSWQMVFSLIFLYLWVWWWISYYVIRLIKEYPQLIVAENGSWDPLDELLEQEIQIKE